MRLPLELAASLWKLASSIAPSSSASSPTLLLSDATRTLIDESRTRWGVQGASIAVVTSPDYKYSDGKWGEEVLTLGIADGVGNPVDQDSLFTIASNSKLFTVMAVGLLIENGTALSGGGTLDWDTKIKDILPPDVWGLQDAYASEHVDITDLASMRSGMPSHDLAHLDVPEIEMVKKLRHLRPTSEIRQVWQYNNMHYFALSHIVTALSGLSLPEYVQEHMLGPLNMTRTTYNADTARKWGGMTDGFTHVGRNGTKCAEESDGVRRMSPACRGTAKPIGWWTAGDQLASAGAGGIITCVRDATKWLRELLSPSVLPAKLFKKFATPIMFLGLPATSPRLSQEAYGMGQVIAHYRGREIVWHTGGWPGETSLVMRAPNDGIAISIFTNDEAALSFFYTAAYRIIDDLLRLDPLDAEIEDVLFAEELKRVPRREMPGDTPAPVGIEGVFHDAGYGTLNITLLPDGPLKDLFRPRLEYYYIPTDGPMFFTPFRHMYTDYLVFTHHNASTWHVALANVHHYPTRKAGHEHRDDEDFSDAVIAAFGPGIAVVTEEGLGMFGGFSVPGPLAKRSVPIVEGAKQAADVWFQKRT